MYHVIPSIWRLMKMWSDEAGTLCADGEFRGSVHYNYFIISAYWLFNSKSYPNLIIEL